MGSPVKVGVKVVMGFGDANWVVHTYKDVCRTIPKHGMLLPVWFPFVKVANSFRLIVYSLLFLVEYRGKWSAPVPRQQGSAWRIPPTFFMTFLSEFFFLCPSFLRLSVFFFYIYSTCTLRTYLTSLPPRGSQPSGCRSDDHAETAFLYIHTFPGLLPLFCLWITQELVYGGRDSANSFLHSPPRQRILLLQGREFAVGSGESDREGEDSRV